MMHHELSNRVPLPESVASWMGEITMHGEVMCKELHLLIEHYKLIKTTKVFVHKGMSPGPISGPEVKLVVDLSRARNRQLSRPQLTAPPLHKMPKMSRQLQAGCCRAISRE